MVDSYSPTTNFDSIEVVNSQNCRPLVFVGQKSKPPGLARNLISGESKINYFSELREDDSDIPLVHSVVEVSNKNVSAIVLIKSLFTSECQEALMLVLFLSSFRLYRSIFLILCIKYYTIRWKTVSNQSSSSLFFTLERRPGSL